MVKTIAFKRALIVAFFVLIPFQILALIQQPGDIRILQSDITTLVIEYTPVFLPLEKYTIEGNEYIKYSFLNNCISDSLQPGMPDIRNRPLVIRLPGPEKNILQVISADYEDIAGANLSPIPFLKNDPSDFSDYNYIDKDAYSFPYFIPASVVKLTSVGETRGKFLGTIEFFPVQYNPLQKTIRKYSRIVVKVLFGPSVKPLRDVDVDIKVGINDDAFTTTKKDIQQSRISKEIKNSVLSSGVWFKFTINEDGMYKLSGQQLLNTGIPSSIDPKTIKIYNNGGMETPLDPTAQYIDDLTQNAIYVYDGGLNNYLDPEDYLIFYGKGVRGWNYNPTNKTFRHYQNRFATENVYWLTYGGALSKQMNVIPSLNEVNCFKPTTVTGKIFREDDKNNINSSGIEWLGDAFTPDAQMVYRYSLPGLDPTQPIRYYINVGARSFDYSYFSAYEHDALLANVNIPRTGGDYPPYFYSFIDVTKIPDFSDNETRLKLKYTVSGSRGTGYLDWYEIFYYRFLKAENDYFMFHSLDTSAVVEYKVYGLSGGSASVFDISKFDSVVTIINPVISADTCTFQTEHITGQIRTFCVVGPNGYRTIGNLETVPNQNLHGDTYEADYIIVSHPEFISAAQRLKDFRESQRKPLKTTVVDVNDIYNEFGGGLPTPAAIRNYLRYVYLNWSHAPSYVLLMGDGDFDYKRIMNKKNPNWIPPWETDQSFLPLSSYASDDPFVIFFDGNRVNLGVGRLTCRSLSEANVMVDKIIEYENGSITDPWKLRFTFVADDGLAGAGNNDGIQHTEDADAISKMIPDLFEKQKIYLYEYPTVYTVGGRRKPEVNTAIKNAINQGTLVINFSGHGNPRIWTHEAVFVRETDIPLLNNKGKYFFLVAATCNYSNFDLIDEQSSGEILVAMPDAGAIAVFSATRAVYADANFYLNRALYNYILDTTSNGRIKEQRLGDIIYRTKQERSGDNDRKFFLLGDPALRLSIPRMPVAVDSVNQLSANQIVSLRALSHAKVKASVRDTLTYSQLDFTGNAQFVVFDANKKVTITEPERNESMTFTKSGSVLFRGEATINFGSMSTEFIVPKDISYENERGRITIYCWNQEADGAGYTTQIEIGGIDTTAIPDTKGPDIKIFFNSRSYRPGDVVKDPPLLIVDLSDSSGINTSGASIGHRLEAWLDEISESIDLTDYYKSNLNTYKEGSIEYPLGSLSAGTHKIRVRVWDTYNNYSVNEAVFDVETGTGLKLYNVFNYPNPFRNMTYFTFEHNQVVPLDVEVKIYTVAGRCIQSLKSSGIVERTVKILWNGLDMDGDPLANGVYLYKIIAKTPDGRLSNESLGKLSVLR